MTVGGKFSPVQEIFDARDMVEREHAPSGDPRSMASLNIGYVASGHKKPRSFRARFLVEAGLRP
ncbi:MAG: hypothetical protein ABII82_03995 [Verrucomicrobiota bacterium]